MCEIDASTGLDMAGDVDVVMHKCSWKLNVIQLNPTTELAKYPHVNKVE